MFPGRPVPQQQNPWELAPEVYVARGRNLGRDEGYNEGYHEGWNDAVDKANRVINQQKQMMQDLQQQVQGRMDVEEYNQQVLLVRIFLDSVETLSRDNPGARKAVLRAFNKHYLRQMEDSVKQGSLRCEIHRDAKFMNEAPRTSRFILDALAS
jgi:hypothetical protein